MPLMVTIQPWSLAMMFIVQYWRHHIETRHIQKPTINAHSESIFFDNKATFKVALTHFQFL